jgi:AcrR family transcriptional regulator
MTYGQIAEEVGVSERTLYRWREKEDFVSLVEELSDRIMKTFISEVDKAVMKSVKNGSVKAMELAYKRPVSWSIRKRLLVTLMLQSTLLVTKPMKN